jgi:transcriptional regulator with XRE-family HTH domain
MSEQAGHAPFQTLGTHLKYLREQIKESLAEVSGAVEIDEKHLEQIEAGHERPAEDILMLLINHFNMPDQEATQLWELAGYNSLPDGLPLNVKAAVVLLAIDARTMYTDGVEVTASGSGITMHFTQTGGQKQHLPVARLGMSYEQAEQVLKALQQGILRGKYQRGPKPLPPNV